MKTIESHFDLIISYFLRATYTMIAIIIAIIIAIMIAIIIAFNNDCNTSYMFNIF